jgi:hypothetical protein
MSNLIPKKIWTLWLNFARKEEGILSDDLTFFIERIKYLHPKSESWEINIITTFDQLYKLIDLKDGENKFIIDILDNNYIEPAHKSDLIRYYLLKTYGGYWIDISTFFLMSISEMTQINNSSFVCYYAPTNDVSEWLISSLSNMYETTNYNDRIKKWSSIEEMIIKLKNNYKEILNVIPENYFIGSTQNHEIINNVFYLLKTFWIENNNKIIDKNTKCFVQNNYIYKLITQIYDINKLSLIPPLDLMLNNIFNQNNQSEIDNYIIKNSISDCGYLFNYLQLYIGIYNYISKTTFKIEKEFLIKPKLNINYELDLCINNNCNDLVIDITNIKDNSKIDTICLLSATFNRLGKWSNNRHERISYENTFLGNKIMNVKKQEDVLKLLYELKNNNFSQLKFSSFTRNSPIIAILKQWNWNIPYNNSDRRNKYLKYKNKYLKYKNKYLKLKLSI